VPPDTCPLGGVATDDDTLGRHCTLRGNCTHDLHMMCVLCVV
jgi:hypothetical protein